MAVSTSLVIMSYKDSCWRKELIVSEAAVQKCPVGFTLLQVNSLPQESNVFLVPSFNMFFFLK